VAINKEAGGRPSAKPIAFFAELYLYLCRMKSSGHVMRLFFLALFCFCVPPAYAQANEAVANLVFSKFSIYSRLDRQLTVAAYEPLPGFAEQIRKLNEVEPVFRPLAEGKTLFEADVAVIF
jgi:hypothetical protein